MVKECVEYLQRGCLGVYFYIVITIQCKWNRKTLNAKRPTPKAKQPSRSWTQRKTRIRDRKKTTLNNPNPDSPELTVSAFGGTSPKEGLICSEKSNDPKDRKSVVHPGGTSPKPWPKRFTLVTPKLTVSAKRRTNPGGLICSKISVSAQARQALMKILWEQVLNLWNRPLNGTSRPW